MMLIIPFIRHFEVAKRNITDNRIKEAVGDFCLFKGLWSNRRTLIELLCYACGNLINLNTINAAVRH